MRDGGVHGLVALPRVPAPNAIDRAGRPVHVMLQALILRPPAHHLANSIRVLVDERVERVLPQVSENLRVRRRDAVREPRDENLPALTPDGPESGAQPPHGG